MKRWDLREGDIMAVIFWDFDGTLAHSVSLWPRCAYEALAAEYAGGLPDFAEYKRQFLHGEGAAFPWRCWENDHTGHTWENFWPYMNEWFAECNMYFGIPRDIAERAAGNVRGRLVRAENYALYEDVIPTLKALKEMGHTNSMISNNYPELTQVMAGLGILEYIENPTISGREGYDKPRRELYDIAKSRFPGQKYYMVGDNPVADIQGSKQAGMTAILVHNGACAEADYCLDALAPITDILKSE